MFKDLSSHIRAIYHKVKRSYSLVNQIATPPKVAGYLPPDVYDVPPDVYDQLMAFKAQRGLQSVEMAVAVILSEYFGLLQTPVVAANDTTASRIQTLETECTSLSKTVVELQAAIATLQASISLPVGESEPIADQSPLLEHLATVQPPSNPIVDQSESLTLTVANSSPITQSELLDELLSKALTQAELAKRFKVHASVLSRQKDKNGFPEWSQSKDPDGVAWSYDEQAKRFQPILPD